MDTTARRRSATSLQFGASAGNPDTIARHGDAKSGLVALERSGIGVGALTPIELLAPRRVAASLARDLSGIEGVHGTAAPRSWTRDELAVVDVLPIATDSSQPGRDVLKRVRGAAHAFAGEPRVGGIIAQNQDFVSAVYGSFPLMVALIAAITFVLLARAFRSLLLPLKAVLLNVLSIAAAWGAVTLVWQRGWGSHAIWGVDASVIRAILVPALVSLFGRWNWWLPPGPARLLRVEPSEAGLQPAD